MFTRVHGSLEVLPCRAAAVLFVRVENEFSIEYVRVCKMRPPDHFDGMMAALAHVADVVNANGKEDVRFDAGGIFHDAFGCEHTFI